MRGNTSNSQRLSGGNQVDGSSSHSVQVTLYVSDDVFSCLIVLFKASAAQIVSITFLLSKLGYVLMNYPLTVFAVIVVSAIT